MSLVAVVVVGLAVVVPLAAVLWRAVWIDGGFSTEALGRILGSPRTWRVVALTIGQALASAALALTVGLPVSWVLARREFGGRGALRTVAMVPFVLPSVVIGAAFATLLGPGGIADLRGTWWAVLAAHVCFNLAVVIRIAGTALESVDPDLEAAARLAGAGTWSTFRRVTLPLVAPAVWSAAIIIFLFCLTSFGVIVVLGGGSVTTIEVELWVRATRQFDLPGAAVLAGLQALMVVVVLLVAGPAASVASGRSSPSRRRRAGTPGQRWAVAATAAAVTAIAVVPLAALVVRSLRVGDGYGLDNWAHLGSATSGTGLAVDPLASIAASMRAALLATALAVVLGVPAADAVARRPKGLAGRVLLLPLAISATTVGLGLLLLAGRPPLDLRRSPALVVFAQTLVALPLVVRAVAPAIARLPPAVLEAARLAGAGPLRRWWGVKLPMVRAAVAAAAGLALVAALGEFGATVFVARVGDPTVPVAIQRLLSRPGPAGTGQAMALSCVLVVLCGGVLAVIDRVGARRGPGALGG